MFDAQDRAYFSMRAETARNLAAQASDSGIRKIHADMAEEYDRRSRGEAPRKLSR